MYHVEFIKKKRPKMTAKSRIPHKLKPSTTNQDQWGRDRTGKSPKSANKSPKSADKTVNETLSNKEDEWDKIVAKKVETGIEWRKRRVPEDSKGTGWISPEELHEWFDTQMRRYEDAQIHRFTRARREESVCKPILRDSNGKAIGRGSF